MDLVALIEYGTPVLIIGMMLMLVRLDSLVSTLRDDVKEIRANSVYQITCDARHDAVGSRIARLEYLNNGRGAHDSS